MNELKKLFEKCKEFFGKHEVLGGILSALLFMIVTLYPMLILFATVGVIIYLYKKRIRKCLMFFISIACVWIFVLSSSLEYNVVTQAELEYDIEMLEQTVKNNQVKFDREKEELNKEKEELQVKVDEAKPWFEMKEEERKAEEERLQKEKEEKERKEKEERERREKEEREEKERKEKEGYNTGITYKQLARTPEKYEGEKVKFSGKVLQVSEGFLGDVIRLGVNGSYDNVLYLNVPLGITEERILEDDYITIYGVSQGIKTYTTVLGASMSIPQVDVDKID